MATGIFGIPPKPGQGLLGLVAGGYGESLSGVLLGRQRPPVQAPSGVLLGRQRTPAPAIALGLSADNGGACKPGVPSPCRVDFGEAAVDNWSAGHSLCHCSPRLLWVERQGLLQGRGWAGDEAPGEDAPGAGLQVTVHAPAPRTRAGPQGPLLGGKDRAPLPSGWQLLA